MIFNSNTTLLGASNIPMAEGYDSSCGAALALVESARNDYAMFNAMLEADWNELRIRKESTGVVQEGEILTLQEAVGGGIFKKIADLFKKLIAKVKSIAHNLVARLNGLYMKDKELVKKYEKELYRKSNLGNLEVKWRKVKKSPIDAFDATDLKDPGSVTELAKDWKEEVDDRYEVYAGRELSELDEFMMESMFDDEDTVKLSEIGGIRPIMTFLNGYASNLNKFNSTVKKAETKLNKIVKEADKRAGEAATAMRGEKSDAQAKTAQDNVTTANHAYDMAIAYQTVYLKMLSIITSAVSIEYKQYKAAFMKAVTANDKKLEESAVYAQAVAEATEQEVEDVITGAISKEELSEINAASKNVKDADVADDPDALTYGPDQYTANGRYSVDGSIDTDIDSKNEAAFFGQLLF